MDDFLHHYEIYSSGNEVPKTYHQWSALSVISALVGRKVWVSQGMMSRIFPNVYILLVGEPASGKSTAMDLGRFLLQAIGNTNLAPAAITYEAMLKLMGDKESPLKKQVALPDKNVIVFTPLHICANELVTLLGAEPTKMISFLTDVYDREVYENLTKGKGHDNIQGPYITLLGCMTPSTVDSMCRSKMITGGFSRRLFLIEGGKRMNPIPRPVKNPVIEQAKLKCIEIGRKIQKIAGEFIWTPDGEEFFDDWYINIKHPAMQKETDPVMSRWWTSKDVALLKITMLLQLANEKPILEINQEGLSRALGMLDKMEKDLPTILGGAGRNVHAAIAARIVTYIQAGGIAGRSEKQIVGNFYNDALPEAIASMLAHLVNIEQIKSQNFVELGRPKPGYVAVACLPSTVAKPPKSPA